jgi:K(+)-stimulated pyrophosphate-energized sodium pump
MLDNFYSVFLPGHGLMLFAPGAAICAILYGFISIKWINAQPACTEQMQVIAAAIQEGANAYLSRQYKVIAAVGIVLFAIIAFFLNWETAGGFVIGSTFSALAGFIGMHVSVRANARTAQAGYIGINRAF